MSPLLRPDVPGSGALGKCRIHRRVLLPEPAAYVEEEIWTTQLARDALAYLDGDDTPPPLPSTPRRRGTCPDCTANLAAAAVAYVMNGDQ